MDSMTLGELVGLMKENNLTLYQMKESLRIAIEQIREISKKSNSNNGGYSTFKKMERISNIAIAKLIHTRTQAVANFLRIGHQLEDNPKNRDRLLQYINATIKAGLNKLVLIEIINNLPKYTKSLI